eukprot:803290-Pelagomonas_calceolata.AAC.1
MGAPAHGLPRCFPLLQLRSLRCSDGCMLPFGRVSLTATSVVLMRKGSCTRGHVQGESISAGADCRPATKHEKKERKEKAMPANKVVRGEVSRTVSSQEPHCNFWQGSSIRRPFATVIL